MRIPHVHSAVRFTIVAGLGASSSVFAAQPTPEGVREAVRGQAGGVHHANLIWNDDDSVLTEDPVKFFERLVDRYRDLRHCREDVRVEQVTVDPETEDPPLKSVVRVVAEVQDERLTVRSSDLLDEVLDLVGPPEAPAAGGASESDLRLLPHLRLRFSPDPLEGFAGGESDDLHPAELDRVMVDDRELLRVELRSGESGASDTTFSLFVDPESMLVERIEGEEWLPGGLQHQTTIEVEARDLGTPESPRDATPERKSVPGGDSTPSEIPNARMHSSV